jgi:hypothetical protein
MILNCGFLASAVLDADAETDAETVALTDADIEDDILVATRLGSSINVVSNQLVWSLKIGVMMKRCLYRSFDSIL